MSYNYTLISVENYEKFEFYFILLQEFVIELIDISKINIILLYPVVLPLLIGYIIGKIQYNRNTYYKNLENKITEINDKLAKCDNLLSETFNNELDNIDFIINNNYSKLNQQILTINDKIESIQIHMSILNELVYSEINNNNISRTNAIEKMTNLIAPLEKRIINIETKENYVLIGYRKSTDIPVFVSTEIIKLSNEEIKKYHLQETCIILPLLTALPKLKEINMTQLEGLWLSFEKIISKNPCTDKLMYAGIHMQLGSEIKPINSVFKHNIPKIESFCNSIGVKLIIE
jgi:hypothetical protein